MTINLSDLARTINRTAYCACGDLLRCFPACHAAYRQCARALEDCPLGCEVEFRCPPGEDRYCGDLRRRVVEWPV